MDESECEQQDCPTGIPEWVMTFADLMSLLMVFFVLLLSFSEMDVQKYKQVAGSMKAAFGVQREIKVSDMPTGTSIVAQEFSPAQPEPSLINEVTQQTTDELKQYLKVEDLAAADAQDKAEALKEALREEILDGLLEISTVEDQVIIRIREKGSFLSASAKVSADFRGVLSKISAALGAVEGKILVAGHTDDIPIQTAEFPSNWVLSAARAAAVTHTMTDIGSLEPGRLEIRAYGENRPLEANDTAEGRAKNRRVEIIVLGDHAARAQLEQATDDIVPRTQ